MGSEHQAARRSRESTVRNAGRRGDHRRGDDAPGDRGSGPQRGGGHERRVVANRERDRMPREPLERADDHRGCRLLIEHVADRPRLDHDPKPVEGEARLAMVRYHLSRHLAELILEGGVIDARCGYVVLPEESHGQTAVATQEGKTSASALGRRDGCAPVDADTELARRDLHALRADDERHRHRREPRGPTCQQTLRRSRLHAADVDARDPRAAGQPVRGAGEDEAHHRSDDEHDHDAQREPGPGPKARSCAQAYGRRRGSHGGAHGSDRLDQPSNRAG